LTRAAVSSIASGSPSSCRQTSAITGAFSAVSAKAGSTDRARSTNSATAGEDATSSRAARSSGRASGAMGTARSPRTRRGRAAGDQGLETRAAREERGDGGGGVDDLLEVVEQEQHLGVAQAVVQQVLERLAAGGLAQLQGLGYRGHEEVGVVDGRQRYPAGAR